MWDLGVMQVMEMGFGICVGIWNLAVVTLVVGFRMSDLG